MIRKTIEQLCSYDLGYFSSGDAKVPTHVTHDLHVTYRFMDGELAVTGSVINMEDDDPAFMSREMNYDTFTHNPFGRMYKLDITYSMGQ
ncbi:MAG: hypothetical protein ABGY43_04105 [bacterium]|nr:hypothetical protein [Gammaproteobacteria bacterium]HIL82929.1 hypothetical protein [Pseudomonadales bacterium]